VGTVRGTGTASTAFAKRGARSPGVWLLLCAAAAALIGLAPIAGCGGGVGEEGTGYASGPITGFGSVIVNDIVFDDSAASVEDGEGGASNRAALRLGMTVEVESGRIEGGSARAARVRFDSAIRGAVEQVLSDGFVVLGQRVSVDETTVYDSALAAGLTALAPGQVVEVYGLIDVANARYRATRVERRPGDFALFYRLRGVVTDIPARNTLRIGNALFSFAGAAAVPSDLAVGSFVRLWVDKTPDAFGRWPVQRFGEAQRSLADIEGIVVKGLVTSVTSSASFRLDGRAVDASAASVSGGTLAVGVRVEVRGRLVAGVFVATRVEVRSDQTEIERGFELRGAIELVDATSLVLRGITVSLTRPGLVFVDGNASDLRVGRLVEVRGVVSSSNGARLDAKEVRFR
jgi:hypothetical protein